MNERKQVILKAIIEDYIATAEPVSSKVISQKYPLQLSPATVRNVMADLEAEGYLSQPHVSAGRLPSDKAYRFYVDSLTDIPTVEPEVKKQIKSAMQDEFRAWETEVKKVAELMSNSTGYTSIAFSPPTAKTSISQIKLLMIEPGRVLVVLVLAPGIVKDRLINVSPELDNETLARINKAIEQTLAGRQLDEITWITVESVAKEVSLPDSLLNQILFEAYMAIKQSDNLDAYLDGLQKMLDHPEFHNHDKAKAVFDMLTKDGMLAGYLAESSCQGENYTWQPTVPTYEVEKGSVLSLARPKFMIRIGQEITLPGLSDCSFVTTTYAFNDKLTGQIGIVGPKRMNYRQVIANINFIRQTLDDKIANRDER